MATAADALALTALVALTAALAPEPRPAEVADAAVLAADMVEDATVEAAVDVAVDTTVDAAKDAEAVEGDAIDAVVEEAEAPADDAAELEALEAAIDDDTEVEDTPDDAPEFKPELCNMLDEVFNALDELCNTFEELCIMLVDDSTKWTVSTVFCVPCDTASSPPTPSSLDLRTEEKSFPTITVVAADAIPPNE